MMKDEDLRPKCEQVGATEDPSWQPEQTVTSARAGTLRAVRMYHRRRGELIRALGGKCLACGTDQSLEFDHPNGRNWKPRLLSRWMRIKNYERDAKAGNLRLLCRCCNARMMPRAATANHESPER